MTSKEKYIDYCNKNNNVSVFLMPWYQDIVNEDWDVSLVEQNSQIKAALIYRKVINKGFVQILSPQFTPAVNPFIRFNPNQKRTSKRQTMRKYLTILFENLPKYDKIKINLNSKICDCRSLIWKGFHQTTQYSSKIEKEKSLQEIVTNSKSSLRSLYKKANNHLTFYPTSNYNSILELIMMTFNKQGITFGLSKSQFKSVVEGLELRGMLIAYVAKNKDGLNVGSIMCVIDNDTVYYLFGGFDPQYKHLGSQTGLIMKCIERSRELRKHFDFEGSMIQGIDRFFMAFDPDIVPYSQVSKTNSFLLKVASLIKSF